jgi:hypothetical protein
MSREVNQDQVIWSSLSERRLQDRQELMTLDVHKRLDCELAEAGVSQYCG